MSAQAAAVAPLDVARARRLTKRLREALTIAVDLLTEVFDGRAWEALGYPTWEQYCAAELPELAQLQLAVDDRRRLFAELRERGMSLRAIGAPFALSAMTVQRDLKAAGVQLATVTALDGRQRSAAACIPDRAPRPRLTNVARAVLYVREAGEDGRTVHEVCRKLRLHHGATSALLSRLAADGRLTYQRPAKRGQTGRYLVPVQD